MISKSASSAAPVHRLVTRAFGYSTMTAHHDDRNASKYGSSRILVGAEGGFHAQFSAVEEDSNAEVLELAEAFGS